MKLLEQKITAEGKVLPGNILKVDGFLNHRIDVPFVMELGKEIARRFENSGVTKILTIEASGIAVATAAAFYLNVPLVFAKKHILVAALGETFVERMLKKYIATNHEVGGTELLITLLLSLGSCVIGLGALLVDVSEIAIHQRVIGHGYTSVDNLVILVYI